MAQNFLSYALSVFGGIFSTCNVCALRAHTLQVMNMPPNTESAQESVEPLRVFLIKHKLVLPDDGPCGPKHVGVILMYIFITGN
jgi:hypothetical protein